MASLPKFVQMLSERKFTNKSIATAVSVAVLIFTVSTTPAYGEILQDGGFEAIYDYPTMYAHENVRIKKVVDAGWDVGGKEKFRFPTKWTVNHKPAGYLRVSKDAHSGNHSIEFGKGGEIHSMFYITPTGTVSKYPFKQGSSCIIRVWAKGEGKLKTRVREFDAGGKTMQQADVDSPVKLSDSWQEFTFIYTPQKTTPSDIQLVFSADELAKIDDASMVEVVEFGQLIKGLNDDLKVVRRYAEAGLVESEEVKSISGDVKAILIKTKTMEFSVSEQLSLRRQIAPIAERLKKLVWRGRGKRAGRIGLSGKRLKVEFYGKDLNYRLASITDPQKGVDFLGTFGSELWRIKLVNPNWKAGADPTAQPASQIYLTSDSKCTSLSDSLSDDGRKLTLKWFGVEIAGASDKLDVRVQVELPEDSQFSRWHINISPGVENCAINEVHFPMLATLTPMTENGAGDYLASMSGRLIENPYKSKSSSYDAGAIMQFWALYSKRAGLYFAVEDPELYIKRFGLAPVNNGKALHAQLVNIPENNMSAGNRYDMPYQAVVGTFDGNWWNASKIYRKWAIEQKWCKAFGPLHSSKDTPQWYKDLPIWTLLYETGFVPKDSTEEDVLSGKITGGGIAGHYRTLYGGTPFAMHYYGWEKGHKGYGQGGYSPAFGMKGWPKLISQLQTGGARVVPYIQGSLYNTKFDWYTKEGGDKGAVYFSGGAPIVYDEKAGGGYAKMTWMCQYSKQWQDKHVEVAKKLAACGVDGIYYDSFPGWFSCYNPEHGHPLGGGKYVTQGNRRLIARTRKAAKAINPEIIFVSESPSESIVGALDGCLQFRFAGSPDNIPMFSSVYHDYLLLWGNTYSAVYGPGHPEHKEWAFVPIAYSFVRGDQLGWFGSGHTTSNEYTTYLAKLKMGPTQKFLTFGEMVEPPTFIKDLPTVTTPPWFGATGEKEPRVFSAVLHSAWKAPDGTVGIVMANISDKDQEVKFEIDVARYALATNRKYTIKDVVTNKIIGTYDKEVFERQDIVPAKKVLILEISTQ